MATFSRSSENPILLPNRENSFESQAVFNGSPVAVAGKIHLVYRAVSNASPAGGVMLELSSIGHAASSDGIHFKNRHQLIKPEYEWERYGCEDPRITKLGNTYYIFYTALSEFPFNANGIKVAVAVTRRLDHIDEKHAVTTFNAKAMALFPEKVGGKMAAVLTANTDRPPAKIALAVFDRPQQLWSAPWWDKWYGGLDAHTIPLQRSPNDQIEVGAAPLRTKYGWLLFFSYIKDYFGGGRRVFGIEAALLDLKDPRRVLARTYKPILEPEEEYEEYGRVPHVVFPSGALVARGKLQLYYGAADTTCCVATAKLDEFMKRTILPQLYTARATRPLAGPLLEPVKDHAWESKAVFNPGAVAGAGSIHLLYRAMSQDNTSVFGYASTRNGTTVAARLDAPAYAPREKFEAKLVPGGNSGCEDPRLSHIENTIYMCYTAFDGQHPPRVALTAIAADDFFARRFNWAPARLISPPDIDDKDASLFPQKIGGSFYIVHRIGNNIWVDVSRDLDTIGRTTWLGGNVIMRPRHDTWDSRKIGLSAPPLETPDGWVMLYHGVSDTSNTYRVGGALLDLKDPRRVLARTSSPILEPEEKWEREGIVPKVVFPCGAVVLKGELYMYYGAADRVVGVAKVKMSELLKTLRREKQAGRG